MRLFARSCALVLVAAAALALFNVPLIAGETPTSLSREQVEQIIHDYLLKHPEVLFEALDAADAKNRRSEQERTRAAIAAKRDELLNDPGSPSGGNPKGDATVVEFFDYRCPYCKQVQPSINALLRDDPNLRIVYKEFPILGPESVLAAHVALAAAKQGKYEPFHSTMMATTGQINADVIMKVAAESGLDMARVKVDMNAMDIDQIVARNHDLARALGINGTPGFVIGDTLIPGAVDLATLKQEIANTRRSPAKNGRGVDRDAK
jgi:protein-disulfide isomerase